MEWSAPSTSLSKRNCHARTSAPTNLILWLFDFFFPSRSELIQTHRFPRPPNIKLVTVIPMTIKMSPFKFQRDDKYEAPLSSAPASNATISQSTQDIYPKILAASQAQSLGEQLNTSIGTYLDGGTFEIKHLRQLVTEQKHALDATRNFIDSCMSSIPINLRPTTASSIKATQVLATPELLEQILLYISPREVLRAVQINKAAHQIFNDSPKLRDKLSLRVSPTGFLDSIFLTPGFCPQIEKFDCIEAEFMHLNPEDGGTGWGSPPPRAFSKQVRLNMRWGTGELPTIGGLCRSMLVCQPPAHKMTISDDCCTWGPSPRSSGGWDTSDGWGRPFNSARNSDDEMSETGTDEGAGEGASTRSAESKDIGTDSIKDVTKTLIIESQDGITIGDIYEAALKMRAAHRHCPHARIEKHNEDGTVTPSVAFTAILDLWQDDPYLLRRAAASERLEIDRILASQSQSAVSEKIMGVYVDPKRTGELHSQPLSYVNLARSS